MTFDVRTNDAIRAQLLESWRTRYLARGNDLRVTRDSDAFAWADAIAFQLERIEAKALQLTREIFPDTASTSGLERHAAVIGLPRKSATRAVLRVTVTADGTRSYRTTDVLVSASGLRFNPTVGGPITGVQTITVRAATAGSAGNLGGDASLTWSPAPSGLEATAPVVSIETRGTDTETDAALAQRVLAYWRERPGGGNRAHWVQWGEAHDGVGAAFVYRARHPTLGNGVPGAVTLCVMGPVPSAVTEAGEPAASGTRLLGSGALDSLRAKILGTGAYAAEGGLAPCTVDPNDVGVTTPTAVPQPVDLPLVTDAAHPFPWAGLATTAVGSTTSTIELVSRPAGLVTGTWLAIPDATVRGGYAYRTATNDAGAVTLDAPIASAPGAGVAVYPLPSNAAAVRAAVLAVFDALGPGSPGGQSARYPAASGGAYPCSLYRSSLVAAVIGSGWADIEGIAGVVDAQPTLVGAVDPERVTPAAEELVTLGALRILPV